MDKGTVYHKKGYIASLCESSNRFYLLARSII